MKIFCGVGMAVRALALAAVVWGAADAGSAADCGAVNAPFAGKVTGAGVPSYIERGSLMIEDANFQGASDQLRHALKSEALIGTDEAETARLRQAVAAMRLPGADAGLLLERFLRDYPSSAMREQVRMDIGSMLFDSGEYAKAMQAYRYVDGGALNPSEASALEYRMAYCLLKFADYDRAQRIYDRLASNHEYAMAARFYLGYIAYAKGDYSRAREQLEKVSGEGLPVAMSRYYLAQLAFERGDYRESSRLSGGLLAGGDAPEGFEAEMRRIYGESAWHLGDEATAVKELSRYVAMVSKPLPSALYILGVDDYKNKRWQHAVDRLTPVSSDDSSMGQSACLYMGQAYLKLDNSNAATLALEKAARMTHDARTQETAFYNLAVARMQGGRVPFGSSVAMFEDFLKRYPDSRHTQMVADYLVSGYMTDNNYQAALAAIEKVARPSDSVLAAKQKVLYGLGTRRLQGGDPKGALGYLNGAAGMGRFDRAVAAEATLWSGECLYELGDYDGAISAYNSYLRSGQGTDANRALAYYDLGYARFARKQFGAALSDFSRFISDTPDKKNSHLIADAYNRLADCYYYASDFSRAADNYGKAYSIDPGAGDYPVFQQGLMKGLRRDYAGKVETLSRMIEEFPSSALIPTALLEMGESYGEMNDEGRAIETYTMLASRYPSSAQGRKARLLLGITYLNAGNPTMAIEHYKKVITDYPSSEEARVAADDLKQVYADRGEVDRYVEFIDRVPEAPRPETAELAELTLQSAEKAMEGERYADALKHASEVVGKYPDSPSAVEALAIKADAEMKLGMGRQALESYTELESKASDAATVNAARMGIMQVSRDMADNDRVVEMADKLLSSSTLGASGKEATAFVKAMALYDLGRGDESVAIWRELASNPEELNGTKSAYYLAQYHFDHQQAKEALSEVNALIDANPPHNYWLARGFILLSDILRSQGSDFEADEYLRSLRQNYPGTESDIFRMIDERLQ